MNFIFRTLVVLLVSLTILSCIRPEASIHADLDPRFHAENLRHKKLFIAFKDDSVEEKKIFVLFN